MGAAAEDCRISSIRETFKGLAGLSVHSFVDISLWRVAAVAACAASALSAKDFPAKARRIAYNSGAIRREPVFCSRGSDVSRKQACFGKGARWTA